MNQALQILRLLGLPKAIRTKKRFDKALPHVRGYAVCSCLWALLETGALDRLLEAESLPLDALGRGLERHVLESILEYLDGLGLVRMEGGRARAMPRLRRLMAEPRGFFELTYAYSPVFERLRDLLSGRAAYPRDVQRLGKYVGRGSGQLCRALPYPVMADMLRRRGARLVLDLGCGDLAFLFFACEAIPGLRAVGIDLDEPTAAYAREVLAASPLGDRIEVRCADMFDLAAVARERPDVDAVTAVDTYHEYLAGGEEKIVGLLRELRTRFPKALLYVGEFCKQPHEKLRRRPTAFLEHHLYHDLTNQTIVDAPTWRRLFAAAGLSILEEKVFDMVGHGYFVLR
ncbi:MAG: methyltransferase domain-containing protein [Planctomycetes bacterium]|nr:methyltransferase domain-containing protein [Planctomycetota bacterium]